MTTDAPNFYRYGEGLYLHQALAQDAKKGEPDAGPFPGVRCLERFKDPEKTQQRAEKHTTKGVPVALKRGPFGTFELWKLGKPDLNE